MPTILSGFTQTNGGGMKLIYSSTISLKNYSSYGYSYCSIPENICDPTGMYILTIAAECTMGALRNTSGQSLPTSGSLNYGETGIRSYAFWRLDDGDILILGDNGPTSAIWRLVPGFGQINQVRVRSEADIDTTFKIYRM
jgi:hypothetical protein